MGGIKLKETGSIVIIAILVVLIAISVWFFVSRNLEPENNTTKQQQTVDTQDETTTEEEVIEEEFLVPDDWTTYTNDEVGFSFSYPKSMGKFIGNENGIKELCDGSYQCGGDLAWFVGEVGNDPYANGRGGDSEDPFYAYNGYEKDDEGNYSIGMTGEGSESQLHMTADSEAVVVSDGCGPLGGAIRAVINLDSKKYTALVVRYSREMRELTSGQYDCANTFEEELEFFLPIVETIKTGTPS